MDYAGSLEASCAGATAIAHATLGWLVSAPLLAFALYRGLEPAFRHLRQEIS